MILNPVNFALTALFLVLLVDVVYFAIFFMIFYFIGWGIIQVLRPILKLLTYSPYGRSY